MRRREDLQKRRNVFSCRLVVFIELLFSLNVVTEVLVLYRSSIHKTVEFVERYLCKVRMAYSIEKAPPTDEAVNKLLAKVGGTLELALNSQELKWSSKRLNADDAHVVAYVVAFSTVLQKLVLGANSIGDAGASSIAEAHTNSASLTLGLPTSDNSSHHSPLYTLPNSAGAQGQQRVAHACSRQLVRGQQHR